MLACFSDSYALTNNDVKLILSLSFFLLGYYNVFSHRDHVTIVLMLKNCVGLLISTKKQIRNQ